MRLRSILAVGVLLAAIPFAGGTGALSAAPSPPATVEGPQETRRADGAVDIRGRTTADLSRACLAEQGAASGWCSAYLMGVADTLLAFGNGGNQGGICNADYAIEDLSETFLTWGRSHEAMRNIDMLAGSSLAFREKWPCGGATSTRH